MQFTSELAQLKLVSYYGCFLVRPPKVTQFDDPENPQSMDILMDALGAEAIVTACPLCQANLESRQGSQALPTFYFSELIGLAFGLKEANTWFRKHLVSPVALLASHGLL